MAKTILTKEKFIEILTKYKGQKTFSELAEILNKNYTTRDGRPFTATIIADRARDAGLEDCEKISGHSLRIGSITQARMNGVPTHEIMAQSGHKTTQMIDRYTKLSNIRETSAAKKI